MNALSPLPPAILKRKAVVYVRQSTQSQILHNLESQRSQYDLVNTARRHGFQHVEVIDDDLGRSANGAVARPGFERLVAWLCAGDVGAVLCLDASRLARNGRDWHHLLELCGLADARVIDQDGVYNPCSPNDRLLLGMKGTISEFELGILRARMLEAARSKAKRGELRINVPIGYIWHRDAGLGFDPDLRVQEAVRLIFSRFRELKSGRQVLLSLMQDKLSFPRPSEGRYMTSFDWTPIRYRNVISVLKNPFYAGIYAYGKSGPRAEIVDGRARKSYGHGKPMGEWEVFLKDHHEGYIGWEEYERNLAHLATNAHGRKGGVKSGRGGRALLSGLLSCARCGCRLTVTYPGQALNPVYRCDYMNTMLGHDRCLRFGGSGAGKAIAAEILRVVQPIAVEAAREAERMLTTASEERRRAAELDLHKAQYEAGLAERRYAACDPDNRLIAATLERNWEAALQRLEACRMRVDAGEVPVVAVDSPDLEGLAEDMAAAWNATSVSARTRQRLVRTLIKDIVVDVDEQRREVILTIHWQGGQHSQLRVKKPKPGQNGRETSEDALTLIRSMAGRWSDGDIAATLNRMGLRTGLDHSWTAARVSSTRRFNGIRAYASADKHGGWLTMAEAAEKLGVSHHVVRRLIKEKILPSEQVMRHAPHQTKVVDLERDEVAEAVKHRNAPCRDPRQTTLPMITNT
ncbi:MAG: recombinase family protein [Gemmobacter sp.]